MSGPPWRIAERWALLRNNCLVLECMCLFVCVYVWCVFKLFINCITVSHPQMYVAGHEASDCPREIIHSVKMCVSNKKRRRLYNCGLLWKWWLDGFGGHSVRSGQGRRCDKSFITKYIKQSNHKMVYIRSRNLLWIMTNKWCKNTIPVKSWGSVHFFFVCFWKKSIILTTAALI